MYHPAGAVAGVSARCSGFSPGVFGLQAIAALSAPVTRINDLLFTRKGRKQAGRVQEVAALAAAVTATFQLLGLPTADAAASMEVHHYPPPPPPG